MMLSMVTPRVRINGWGVPASYGLNVIPVNPGHNRIECDNQWMRTYGQAAMDLDVRPGQHVPVFYATPLHQFTTGAIGHEKQKHPGLAVLLAILVGIPVVILLVCVAAAVLSG